MKRGSFIVFLLLASCCYLTAQMENSLWYFGHNAGMDFRDMQTYPGAIVNGTPGHTVNNIPKAVTGPIYTNEGCFSLCDKNGNFIMASDGSEVYNGSSSSNIMENGTGLYGNSSSTQSGVFVPRPNHPGQFYIITGTSTENAPQQGLNYSIIDMSYNSGAGKVIQKNIPLDFGGARVGTSGTGALIDRLEAYEGIGVYAHSDGVNFWMVNRTRDKFFTWLITEDGIGPSPVQVAQANEDGGILHQMATGTPAHTAHLMMLKFSIDGTFIASSFTYAYRNFSAGTNDYLGSYIIVCKFDNTNGKVSNITSRFMPITATEKSQFYGLEFSPDNEYLYHCIYPQVDPVAQIWKIPKANYFTTLAETPVLPSADFQASNIGIGPDDRLYCIGYNQRDLVIFQNPNEGATNWIKIPDYFTYPNVPRLGLPNFVYSFFGIEDLNITEPVCSTRETEVSIKLSQGVGTNAIDHIVWDFGDGSPAITDNDMSQLLFTQKHTYKKTGRYTLTIIPYRADGSILENRVQTIEVYVKPCVLPVNPNIHMY